MHGLLNDIGIAVLAATVLGLIAHWTRQPIILGYLIAGAIVGPELGLKLIHEKDSIEVISEIGLILLLFIIGLEMNIGALLASGKQLLVTGFGQFPICAGLGLIVFVSMGYALRGANNDALYLALMCGLSSTAIVVKLLYDKGELDTLPGRMTLGVLVIQDIYAIFILAFQPNFSNPTPGPVVMAILGTVGLLTAGFLLSRYVLQHVFASIAKAPEMVVAVSIGWCVAIAAAAEGLKLSKEMGALVAGLSISAFPYSIHVTAKTLPLRDFFLTLFFVSLGMKIAPPQWDMAVIIGVMVVVAVASRFLSIYPLLIFSGAGRRTAFISSLNLAQISEFSLVIGALGADEYKHIGSNIVAVTIYAMAITAVMSSYAIRYNHQLYLMFDRLMARLGRGSAVERDESAGKEYPPVAVLGFHRVARSLVEEIERQGRGDLLKKLYVIDFNPESLRELQGKGIKAAFGDISSADTLEHSHLHHSSLILCTIPDMLLKGTDNQTLVKICRGIAPHAKIVAMADDGRHEQLLMKEGADAAINAHAMAARELVAAMGSVEGKGQGEHESLQPQGAELATDGHR